MAISRARKNPSGLTLGKNLKAGSQIRRQKRPGQIFIDSAVNQPQNLSHIPIADFSSAKGKKLIEQTQAVPHAAFGLPGDHLQGALGNNDLFRLGDPGKKSDQLNKGNPLEFIALTTGEDGNRDLMQLGGGKHEIDMGRGLFQGLQQGIKGLGGEHVYFIDDDDLVAPLGREKTDIFLEFADLLDATIGRTVNLMEIHGVAGHDFQARLTPVTGHIRLTLAAVERLGHEPRQGSFANPAHPGKKHGMGHPVPGERIAQGAHHGLLTDNLVKILGTPFSG